MMTRDAADGEARVAARKPNYRRMIDMPRYLCLLVSVALAAGCSDDFVSINQNPNAPTESPSEFLLVSAMQRGVQATHGALGRGTIGNIVQHTSAIEYAWDDRYDIRDGTFNGAWNTMYSAPLMDVEAIIQNETAANFPNRLAVGMILKAWLFHHVTDLWGDVPFREALQGASSIAPGYDPQQQIYADLINMHKEARAKIQPGALAFTTHDLFYNGDMTRWSRLSASLQLRLGMRMSEADPNLARTTVQEAIAAGVLTSRADDALMRWLNDNNSANPWWSGASEAAGGARISATIVDTLSSMNDPRLPIYARPNNAGQYVGMRPGLDDNHAIQFVARSRIGERFVRVRNTPSVIISYPEVLLLRAEAAQRGWVAGDVAALYHEAIAEHMRFLGIAEGAITAYLAQPAVVYNAARGREQILLQKWIMLFGNSLEAWAEWRRTGVPTITPGPDNVTNGRVPRRMLYPSDEQSLNNSNLQAAISRQGGGTQLWDRLWFDKRP